MSSAPTELKLTEDRAIYNMHDAKSKLSRLVDQAAAGCEIIIAGDGKPAASRTGARPIRWSRRMASMHRGWSKRSRHSRRSPKA